MNSPVVVPEVEALHRAESVVRIPPSENVPVSDRVRRILDSVPMRRLASISQLGMAIPTLLLYEGSIIAVQWIERKRAAADQADEDI